MAKGKTEYDARQTHDRADREVDATGQNDEGHADRDDADDHGLIEKVQKIRGLEKIRR